MKLVYGVKSLIKTPFRVDQVYGKGSPVSRKATPSIEHRGSVCYKKLISVSGGSGDGQREFESRLRPPFKFS
jgi:hypothetical protein